MATRVTSTRLIGRTGELAELEAAFSAAADGHPSIAFVAGESGVGKSRLVSELSARVKARGGRTLCGECVELGEGELPYAPLVGALRPLSRDGDRVLDVVGETARAELATLLPELGSRGAPPRPDEGAGTAQRRLFEALLALLERLGREDPVLLLLEDIHWADSSTRAFLAFIARAMSTERVLAVCTYRSDELHRRHPLRPLLAELERDPTARRIELARLSRGELSEQLADILDGPPADELVERLYGRSEGNPLFAEELLASGGDGRGALPPTLRDALMVRTERLPEAAQEVLRVLAVAQRADHALLADASGLEAAELRTALREAAASHLIVASTDGMYRFRHALLREVVHDDLLPGEHAELHLALARALERRAAAGAEDVWITAGMAHHFRSAGDQPAALRASVQAAAASARVHAHGEAAGLLERALEVWERVPDAEALAGASHADLLVRAAAAHRSNVDDHRRAELLRLAVSELERRETDPHRLAEVLGELASAQWSLGRGEESRATLRRALALLPDGDRSAERAELLSRRVAFLMLQGRYGEVREEAPVALEAARAVGADQMGAPILNRLGVALYALGDPEGGEAAFGEAVRVASAAHQAIDAAFVAANRGDALHRAGRSREGLDAVIAAQQDVPAGSRAARWLAMQRAEIEIGLGEWDAAEAHLPHRGRLTGTTLAYFNITRASLLLGRGETRAARPLLEESARILALSLEPQFLAGCGARRAELEQREGNLDAARAVVEEAIDRIEFCSEDGERLAEVACAGVRVEADAAERARDLGDAEAERGAVLRAEMMQARVQAAADDLDLPVLAAHAASAAADLARAAGEADPALYAATAEAWAAIERPYPAAVARFAEAEAHLRAGDREATVAAARIAAESARELGAHWLLDEVEGLAARARLRLDEEAPAALDPEEEAAFGLTPRELQVLSLLAGGATNREIGAQLFMAEKTASVHVSRILSKLDVRSRTEAAAVAHRHGLEATPR